MSNRPHRPTASGAERSAPSANRRRTLLIAGAIAAVVVLLGVVIALSGSGDNKSTTTDTRPVYGPVVLEGAALPAFTTTAGDSAVGTTPPRLEGTSPKGAAVSIAGTSASQPTLVVFLAHWCPHCQRELPLLVKLMAAGDLDGMRVVAVLTGTSPDRPNFPPTAWIDREGWKGEVLLDDDTSAAAQAYGLSSYPYLVFLDSKGQVVARTSGEVASRDIVALADEARLPQ